MNRFFSFMFNQIKLLYTGTFSIDIQLSVNVRKFMERIFSYWSSCDALSYSIHVKAYNEITIYIYRK